MDPRYAVFIWSSFGLAAVAVLWNVLAPIFQRRALLQQLSEVRDDLEDAAE